MSIPSYLSHTKKDNPHMDTARIGLSHMGRKAQQHTIPTWIQPASGSHTWGGKHNNTQSPHGYSPHRALTHGEESTTHNPHMDTARIGLSHMGKKAQQPQSPHGYSPHRALTHGEESTTHNPHMDTARIGLSHMGKKAQHTIPTWIQPASCSHTWGRKHNTQSPHGYNPHRALTHGEESTTTTIPTWIQPASGSHTWGRKHNTQSPHGYSPHRALTHGEEGTTHNPHMDTGRIGLSHMGKKAQHTIPTWIQPASGSHTWGRKHNTIHTWIQPASGSHTWGRKHNNTQSPHEYSPHRALTHGEESTTHNPHMDTARIGLSHMGRKAQQHTIPTWIQPALGSHTWGRKHNTQSPHGYSPHRALTHGEESTTTHNPHMDTARIGLSHMGKKAQHTIPTWIQPASGSHTWGRKHNNTQSPHGYSPHRALTHGEESTTHNPHMDTARIGLSHMGKKAQQHTIPTWIQPASGSHTWGGKHNNTQSPHGYSPHRALTHGKESTTHNPHMDTARIGLSHMGKKAQHTIPTWIQPASGSHTWGGKHNNTQSPHGYSPHRALTHGEENTTHKSHIHIQDIMMSRFMQDSMGTFT